MQRGWRSCNHNGPAPRLSQVWRETKRVDTANFHPRHLRRTHLLRRRGDVLRQGPPARGGGGDRGAKSARLADNLSPEPVEGRLRGTLAASWFDKLTMRVERLRPRKIARSHLIVVHHQPLRLRHGLAGEDEPALDLPRLQAVVGGHLGLALDEPGAAGAAHAALAGVGHADASRQRGIDHLPARRHDESVAYAIEDGNRLRADGAISLSPLFRG